MPGAGSLAFPRATEIMGFRRESTTTPLLDHHTPLLHFSFYVHSQINVATTTHKELSM